MTEFLGPVFVSGFNQVFSDVVEFAVVVGLWIIQLK